jgi:putative resolvase
LFYPKDYLFVKLSVYAHKLGIHYHTAWRWFKAGKIAGYQADTGTIIVTESLLIGSPAPVTEKVAIYTRVSAAENKSNLEAQAGGLQDYCAAKGWVVAQVVKEIGSGINDNRPKLLKLLTDPTVTLIVVEHKDRLTRFGFNYIEQLLTLQGRRIEVINQADTSTGLSAGNGKEELIQDFGSIVTSFCARLYGQRRCKRTPKSVAERIIAELRTDEENHSA